MQLHLVGSKAPPGVIRSLWPPHGEKVPQELEPMALPSLSPLGHRARGQQPHPRVWAAPALLTPGVLGQKQLMDAHAAARTQKHFCTHTACAELAVAPRPSLCLQEEVKRRELPPYQMEAVLRGWTAQLLPAREVWEQV